MDRLKYLKKVPLFSEFGKTDISRLSKISKLHRYKRGDVICREDTAGEFLYVVVSGNVKIFAASGKKKKTLAYLEEGEFFGEMSLLDTAPRSASAVAVNDCDCMMINKKDFQMLLKKYPDMAYHVLTTLSKRLRQADKEIEVLTFENVLGRIAKTLLDLSRKYGERSSEGCRIKMHLSHQELAEIAGTGREMVSRTLNRFRRFGCVEYKNRCLVIKNVEKLKEWIY